MEGRLSYREGKYSLMVSKISEWIVPKSDNHNDVKEIEKKPIVDYSKKVILLNVDGLSDVSSKIRVIMSKYIGSEKVYCQLGGKIYEMKGFTKYSDELIDDFKELLGSERIILKDRIVG